MTCRQHAPWPAVPDADTTPDWPVACDPQWLALHNRLHRHRLSWQGLCAGEPITVQVAGVAPVAEPLLDVHLTLANTALRVQLPRSALASLDLAGLTSEDLSGLPGAMLLELALLAFIEPLERLTGYPLRVTEAPEAEPFALQLTLAVTLGEQAPLTVPINLSPEAALRAAELLDQHLPMARHTLGSLAWRVNVEAGEAPLTVAELRSLRPGDVVMLDDWPAGQVRLMLSDQLQVRATLEGAAATLLEQPMPVTSVKEHCMTDSTFEPVVESSLDELMLKMVCQVGSVELSLAQLRDMGVGSVLQLTSHVHDDVDLMVNGRRIGQGQLVKMGDSLGVRLLSLVTP